MKKTTLVIMLLAILTVSCLLLVACQPSDHTTGSSSEHSCEFGEWTVIEQATCTEVGLKVQVCECGESQTEIIPAGHSYTSVVTDPNCIEQGYTTHTCAGCGDSYVDTYVDAVAHNFQQSDTCEGCGQNLVDTAVESYDMSATADDNVMGYVVPRLDGKYDAYIKGCGEMKDHYYFSDNRFKLVNAYICDGVTNVGSLAFDNCESLTGIVISDSVTVIEEAAFMGCVGLTSIVIPDSVTSIEQMAFNGCKSLTNIIIGDNVTSIGHYAFQGCESLTSIVIPDSVTSIKVGVFMDCKSLTAINVDENNAFYKSIDGNIYSKDGKTFVQYATGKTNTSFDIPDSVTSISAYAFVTCLGLNSIVIPNSITSIGELAFVACGLTDITIPDSVTSIGQVAFGGCSSLTSVVFEDPNGWYISQTEGATSGTGLTLTNASTNVTYLTSTYYGYYWYKNN